MMDKTTVLLTLDEGASLPEYKTDGSAGADLRAHLTGMHGGSMIIEPGKRALVPTGLHIQLPLGFEGQIRSRSGLAFEFGVMCLNSPGTIDSDYRGEVKVLLANFGDFPFVITNGDRIAQLVVVPVIQAVFSQTGSLEDTGRGVRGFGSTGR
jgi:dUTP pyrophosphatase